MIDDDGETVCARCAKRCGTCCTLIPGQEEFCFPLSPRERAAMEAAGAEGASFASQANTPDFLGSVSRLFPGEEAAIAALFPPEGAHDRLAIDAQGACRLLGPKGCVLPRAARPLYCRLFPFWIRAGRELFFEFKDCEAQREAGGGASLKLRLGMNRDEIRQTYQELRTAWGLPELK